jgi:hypothetical protein
MRMFTDSDFSDGSGPWTCGLTRKEAHDLLDAFWDDCEVGRACSEAACRAQTHFRSLHDSHTSGGRSHLLPRGGR